MLKWVAKYSHNKDSYYGAKFLYLRALKLQIERERAVSPATSCNESGQDVKPEETPGQVK